MQAPRLQLGGSWLSQNPSCPTQTKLGRLGPVGNPSGGRRGSRPNPHLNQRVLGRRRIIGVTAPHGGAVRRVRSRWSPATGLPASPRVSWCSAHRRRESQTAGEAPAARTSPIHPGARFSEEVAELEKNEDGTLTPDESSDVDE